MQRTKWSTYLIKWTFQFPWRPSDPLAAAKEPPPWCSGMLSYIQINTSPHNPGQQHCCFLGFFCVIERYFRIRKVVNKTKHALTHRLYKKLSLRFRLEIIYVEIKCALVTSLFLNILLWHVTTLILTYNVMRRGRYWFFSEKTCTVRGSRGSTSKQWNTVVQRQFYTFWLLQLRVFDSRHIPCRHAATSYELQLCEARERQRVK